MAIVDLLMPKMGESIMEATILKWNKRPGDFIQQDESLLEIATDKVDSEVPSTTAGIVKEILFPENAVVPVGSVIARIDAEVAVSTTPNGQSPTTNEVTPDTGHDSPFEAEPVTGHRSSIFGESPAAYRQPSTIFGNEESEKTSFEATSAISEGSGLQDRREHEANSNGNRFYSPLVLNIAKNEGIPLAELEKIPGSGNEGRVTKKDILSFVTARKGENGFHSRPSVTEPAFGYANENIKTLSGEKPDQTETITANFSGNVEIQEMDRMRKLIAEHMVRSKQTSPHVTSFSEADVTNLVSWREKEKGEFEKREGTKLTLTPLFIEAVIKCIKKYPLINSSLQGDKIIIRKDINIGMATALPTGSLIVPVIKNADNYNRVGLARQVNTLANNARLNKLKPEDIQEGTFTITNVGVFGSLMGTPIINQPQVAILAVGAIKKRPVVIETDQGDAIGIRHMMYLSMSYDHRIIDGSLGATFLTAVAKELEAFQG
ncbi:MAG TPA: dihydrolipoamide acetyltransferase family protein [Puia sp.]|nr:dihydrolipoamide acetyltransferase family protein [Puia sp.]